MNTNNPITVWPDLVKNPKSDVLDFQIGEKKIDPWKWPKIPKSCDFWKFQQKLQIQGGLFFEKIL